MTFFSSSGSRGTSWVRSFASDLIDLPRGGRHVLSGDVPEVVVVGVHEAMGLLETRLRVAERADGVDHRRQLRQLLPDLADALVARGHLGVGHETAELVIALLDLRQAAAQAGGECLAHG